MMISKRRARERFDARLTTTGRATQADAQGFNKPSPGFILEPSQPLSELKNAQIEVRDARGERIVATGKQRNSRTRGPLENHRVPHGLRANGD